MHQDTELGIGTEWHFGGGEGLKITKMVYLIYDFPLDSVEPENH